jgi:hypothetical protein
MALFSLHGDAPLPSRVAASANSDARRCGRLNQIRPGSRLQGFAVVLYGAPGQDDQPSTLAP